MTTPVIDNARLTVPAPVRKPRRYGIFSVVTPHDGGDGHWMLGGLHADGEQCSEPMAGTIVCGPSPAKSARSWYDDIPGDPWLAYMYETCKTIGRWSEAEAKLRTRFLAAEQSAVESGLQLNILTNATDVATPGTGTVAAAIGALEADAAKNYGAQIIIHLPGVAATAPEVQNLFVRVGDHLETLAGNLVSIGNYDPALDGGAIITPIVYGTGAMELYRSSLTVVPPQYAFTQNENDYYVLVERAYAALVDCWIGKATGELCGCGAPA